ncbi:MAG: transcription elongation factor Spt5 [Candidatus Aenigmarchaeota archaeon]|nr:transcription elongation factor Spt5 [Candidatus Aenigmarchaeota archaeon]
MIYTVKTVAGRENIVLDAIASKAKSQALDIRALVHPEEIKGYVFVEGEIKDIEKAVQMVPHVRGIIKTPVELKEIQRFLEPTAVEIELDVGDTVEIIGGPFKGEKGKVVRYDKTKRESVIELLDVTVPIPITISVEFIKILEKVKKP